MLVRSPLSSVFPVALSAVALSAAALPSVAAARQLPVGDTLFADMCLAYELLSDPLKQFLEPLEAVLLESVGVVQLVDQTGLEGGLEDPAGEVGAGGREERQAFGRSGHLQAPR